MNPLHLRPCKEVKFENNNFYIHTIYMMEHFLKQTNAP